MLFASPKNVLLILALLNFLAVPIKYADFCFYNWRDEFYIAFSILVAAVSLRVGKLWSYCFAILTCYFAIENYINTVLLYLGFSFLPTESDGSRMKFEIFLRSAQNHPEELIHPILALTVIITATCYILNTLKQRRNLLK
ncbi:MAG: hypothetical protein H7Z37_13440 [Pyrinomonadaceae bacterium]|nr:hypothetical protein [Pyrinomonadaceae bacterium]